MVSTHTFGIIIIIIGFCDQFLSRLLKNRKFEIQVRNNNNNTRCTVIQNFQIFFSTSLSIDVAQNCDVVVIFKKKNEGKSFHYFSTFFANSSYSSVFTVIMIIDTRRRRRRRKRDFNYPSIYWNTFRKH